MAEEVQQEKKNLLTREGLKRYEDELHDLKVNRRQEVAQKIKEAREQGDLSENAEYDAAKDEQRDIEERISVLEKILKNVEVIADEEVSSDAIGIGTTVTIRDLDEDDEEFAVETFAITGSTEADSLNGSISNESPVGKALLNHRIGETVVVETPGGDVRYEILNIQKTKA